MAIEIERKFLLRNDDWRNFIQSSSTLRQAYILHADDRNLRIRIKNEDTAKLTIKIGRDGLVRSEYEYDVPLEDALELIEICDGVVLEKTRHLVHWDNHTWEIDEFSGIYSGLITAEVELDATDDLPTIPDWIGEELTSDRRYSNQTLATQDMRAELALPA
jgi:adenylate cyclase